MASGISYPIQGKYNPKGEKAAISGISNITKAAKTFNLAVKGFVVAKVFQGINKVVSGSTEVFANQNKALVNFNKAVSNNAKLSMSSLESLNATMTKLSRNNFFDGDSLNNAAALAATMGLNEEQIKNVLSASTDLAAATGQDLNSAVKTLSQSYSGNVGQLQKLNPEIKKLTKEQLENGEAVRLVAEQYKGYAETMSNTFSGRSQQFANSFSDLQASVGGIIQAAKFGLEGKLFEPLNKITSWINDNKETIIKFLYGLPDIIKTLGLTAWEMIKKTFTSDEMKNLFTFYGKSLLISIKASLKTSFELFKGLFSDVLVLLDFVFGNTWRNLEDLCGKLGNKVIEVLNKAFQVILSTPGIKQLYEWLSGNTVAQTQVITFKFKTDNAKDNISFKDVTDTFNENFQNLINTYKTEVKNGITEGSKALKEFTSFYSELTEDAITQIKDILSKDLPEDLKQAMVAGIVQANNSSSESSGVSVATKDATKGLSTLTQIIQNLGDVGQAVALALSQNWIGLILMLIAKLVSALQSISDSFSAFTDSISTIMGIVAEIIKPMVEDSIKPFLDGMQNVGTIIGELLSPIMMLLNEIFVPILNLLTQSLDFIAPIVKIIGTLLELFIQMNPVLKIFGTILKVYGDILKAVYNYVLVPVVNFLLKIITAIGNFFIRMYNGVVGVLNSIEIFGWRPFNFSKKSGLDYGSMKLEKIDKYSSYEGGNSSDGSSGGSSKSGGSASYTAARDTFVNIYFSNSFINGDSEQIAIMLAREIKRAEAKNLI